MTKGRVRFTHVDAVAGCREPFVDADLYDLEYRHRRTDVAFYRALARNRMEFARGTVLDLACGSGRLLVPLVRDGHTVIGLDSSPEMLAAATRRVARLSASRRAQCTLVRADLRKYHADDQATLALCAFHSIQHLLRDNDLTRFMRATRRQLVRGGWLAFDVLPPDAEWLARDPQRRWGRTRLRHPVTGQRLVYTTNHVYDPATRLLHMRLYYQPVDESGEPCAPEWSLRLCHRQLWPSDVRRLLDACGFRLVEVFADFHGTQLAEDTQAADEHVYVAVAV